ncbi:MAG: type II secretion system GspH family protein [Phycisphaerales bacterium]|nr:type II secretion system GspH family protein [Phycisphaerales bacterium]
MTQATSAESCSRAGRILNVLGERRGETARAVVAAVLLWGGTVKSIYPDDFGRVVHRVLWEIPSPSLAVGIGLGVAALEVSLGLLLVLDRVARLWLRVGILVLACFSLVLLRLLLMPDPPSCGCLSSPGLRGGASEHWLGLVRNAGLAWIAILGLASGPDPVASPGRGRMTGKAMIGFTLIETLVTISIIAILLGFLLPSLVKTRDSAYQTRFELVQRQLSVALAAYTEDFNATFPFFGTRGDPYGPVRIGDTVFDVGPRYFKAPVAYWATVLVPGYIPERATIEHETARDGAASIGSPELVIAQSALTASAHAEPKFFTDEARRLPLEPGHFRAMRTFEVAFPSSKGMLSAWGAPGSHGYVGVDDESGFPFTFADGSTQTFAYDEVAQWASVEIPWFGNIPMHTTESGLAGRDR